MEIIKKYKKLIVAIIFIITILLSTKVSAITVIPTWSAAKDNHFVPYKADGKFTFYCIHRGWPYMMTLPADLLDNPGYIDYESAWCNMCEAKSPTKGSETMYSMEYDSVGTVDSKYYQDAAYVIANALKEGKIEDMQTQWSLWHTSINLGNHNDLEKGTWGREAVAFRNFFNDIHEGANYNDIYSSKIYDKTDINNVTVKVNQKDKTYTVGPFVIEYPIGTYGNKVWSHIEQIELLNQENNAIGNVTANTIHIVDGSGNEIESDNINDNWDKNGKINFPNNNQEFYVKFSSTLGNGNVTNIKLNVKFKYLESCSATLQKYEGKLKMWCWEEVRIAETCSKTHRKAAKSAWKLKVEETKAQELVAFQRVDSEVAIEGEASMNDKIAELKVAPSGINLTMKIAGHVFLDEDRGKVNEGNNIMDTDEGLNGVEVVLYDAKTNQIVASNQNNYYKIHSHTNDCYELKEHIHIGDPDVGGGCYTNKIHTHIGSVTEGGPGTCFETPIIQQGHVHTGNPEKVHIHDDGCEGHTHTDECYEEAVCNIKITQEVGQSGIHSNCPTCGGATEQTIHMWWENHDSCGLGKVWPEAGGYWTCNTCGSVTYGWGNDGKEKEGTHKYNILKCSKEESGYSCGYKEGQIIPDGCYNVPVYHTHTDECGGHVHTEDCVCTGQLYTPVGSHMIHVCRECGWNDYNSAWGWQYESATIGADCYWHIRYGDVRYDHYKCGKEEGSYTCGMTEGQIERYACEYESNGSSDSSSETVVAWELTCKEHLFDASDCTKENDKVLNCNKTGEITQASTPLINPVLTETKNDVNGYYEFNGIRAFDASGEPMKYYVKFVYNGMIYTNVLYDELNDPNGSKAEEKKNNIDYRTNFNNKYAEIGSYPANYEVANPIFDETVYTVIDGKSYNKVYKQEDIVEIFKKISAKMVDLGSDGYEENLKTACEEVYKELEETYKNNKTELKRMVQYAADCRISAYTVKNYPIPYKFTISSTGTNDYPPIYSGTYDQLHVNLGIKNRYTFDLNMIQSVQKADVSINGKTHTYKYDTDVIIREEYTPFNFETIKDDYFDNLKNMYKNDENNAYIRTIAIKTDSYDVEVRSEEIKNGKIDDYNYELRDEEKLKIEVTYKIDITNTSNTIGAVTEIVDYYDKNYTFVRAYIKDKNGEHDIANSENSKYGTETEFKKDGKYNTIYLRPNEKRLGDSDSQYIYVVFKLATEDKDAGQLLEDLENKSTLNTMNLAEINGYKTYNSKTEDGTPGLVDINSNPGNLDLAKLNKLNKLTDIDTIVAGKYDPEYELDYNTLLSMYEDDTWRATKLIFKTTDSKTLEGTVFEDVTKLELETNKERTADGKLKEEDIKISGVKVELVEIKNNEEIVRATTYTNNDGWYGFTRFIPGDYKVRFTYGQEEKTAMTSANGGENDKSYNGQDYQSTTHTILDEGYWYDIANIDEEGNKISYANTNEITRYSDAEDTQVSRERVLNYSNKEYDKAIINHKAEVFNSYINYNKQLADELMKNTYRVAETKLMPIEIEYARTETKKDDSREYKIVDVDFGIVERPREELVIDQDIANIKVTLQNGTVYMDADISKIDTNSIPGLKWVNGTKINKDLAWAGLLNGKKFAAYDKDEAAEIIMDNEIMQGATIEITYNITVTNNGELGNGTSRAKNIINYVANNLFFDEDSTIEINGKTYKNSDLWEVVSKDDIQKNDNSTFINKSIDLNSQSVILKATENNPLTNTKLDTDKVNSATAQLKLKRVIAAETSDDLRYTNMTEIVEIENELGRYDHGAIPGNQKLNEQPQEHDTSGASRYTSFDSNGQPNSKYPQDGTVTVIPPTGSNHNYIYIVIGMVGALMLLTGIILIKKFVVGSNK